MDDTQKLSLVENCLSLVIQTARNFSENRIATEVEISGHEKITFISSLALTLNDLAMGVITGQVKSEDDFEKNLTACMEAFGFEKK